MGILRNVTGAAVAVFFINRVRVVPHRSDQRARSADSLNAQPADRRVRQHNTRALIEPVLAAGLLRMSYALQPAVLAGPS
jgi:hypothetical protein